MADRPGHDRRPDTNSAPPPTADAAELQELLPGIHAWVQPDGTWWVNNAGAVADDTATGGAPVRQAS